MGINYLWDTNTVVYYLQRQFPPRAEQFIDNLILSQIPVISLITELELLCWNVKNNDDKQALQDFLKEVVAIELNQQIKLRTAIIRKIKSLKLPMPS